MPELPEVETVRAGLARLLPGKVVRRVEVFDSPRSFPNDLGQIEQFLYNAVIINVRRRAKVLLIDLDSGYSLVIHLKMTGQLVFRGEASFGGGHPTDSLIGHLPDRSTRVRIDFTDDSHLFFNDQRKFGWIKLVPTLAVDELPFMQKVGPEPLSPDTTDEEFIRRIRRHQSMMMKPAFLDQSVIAGVGNIYADEALWAAKIHPETRVRDVSDAQLSTLFTELRKVLRRAIDEGGSTDKNYVDAEGRRGNYLRFAHVFRREGQPCPVHPDQSIIKIRVGGRGTHICPVCQVRIDR
jgi:formamidopyrimidine-DNA glycosylase